MLTFKRPLLAAPLLPSDIEHTDENILKAMEQLRYPVLATLKIDGVRAIRLNGSLLSRTLKPIPNKSIRERSLVLPGGFDMELYNSEMDYNTIQSIVMSREHPDSDKIQFHVLDWFGKKDSVFLDNYQGRMNNIHYWYIKERCIFDCVWSLPKYISRAELLFEYFLKIEKESGEGICFRSPTGKYKQGRSTLKEGILIKLCRYTTSEARIVGFEEQMCNGNLEQRNGVGSMDRSKSIGGMIPKNTLGAIVVRDIKTDVEFKVGTGFTDKQRKQIWDNRDCYYGQTIVVSSKGHGQLNKPRCPSFKGFRNKIDIV